MVTFIPDLFHRLIGVSEGRTECIHGSLGHKGIL